tara:strand:- start:257 stop:373 length:117 start_codon:yes stop_codon:yes gene_type:complete
MRIWFFEMMIAPAIGWMKLWSWLCGIEMGMCEEGIEDE